MSRVVQWFGVLSLAFLTGAAPPPPAPEAADLKAMQGTWIPTRRENWWVFPGCWGGGWMQHSISRSDDPSFEKKDWVIEGDRLSWRNRWTITLNKKKVPAEIDIVRISYAPALHWRGLYRLDGDTLYIALDGPERPKRLGGSKAEEGHWAVYKRKKP